MIDQNRIALVSQPRCPGATAATSAAAADKWAALLSDAGFQNPRVETLDLDPPAVCVLANNLVATEPAVTPVSSDVSHLSSGGQRRS